MRGECRSKIRDSRGWCEDTCSGKAKEIAANYHAVVAC
jgi:hypothetical protein